MVGNKTDLKNERVVTTQQGEEFAKLNHVNKFIEASAKEGINTQNTFIDIAKLLFEEYNKYKDDDQSSNATNKSISQDYISEGNKSQKLSKKNTIQKQKKCCK